MSRDKFEEWFYSSFEPAQWKFMDIEFAYAAWLAGRESMRDEAATMIEEAFDFVGDEILAAEAIRKIEP